MSNTNDPERMTAVTWYTCKCDWWTKFCDEHHRAFARVPVEVLEQYRVDAPSYEEEA